MWRTYFISTFQTLYYKNGEIKTIHSSATIKIKYAIGDFESISAAQDLIKKDTILQNKNVKDATVTIVSYQHISSNPF